MSATSTNLINTADNTKTIETLSSGTYTDTTFTVNKWGYKNGLANDYIGFSGSDTILSNATKTNNDTTTLRFATKIDYTKPSGLYQLSLNFKVLPIVTQTYMQDVTSDFCTEDPKVVIDKRDEQLYTISRLADGQCWMTSNLNLAGGTTLNASDSDVPTDNYYTLPASSTTGFDDDTKAYVYNTGNETTSQTSAASNSYYSWLAATAGGKDASDTAVTSDGPDAAYSICPKGWRLPKSGNQSDISATSTTGYKKGDFYKLATAYGANLESSYRQDSAVFYNNAGPGTLTNFLLAGRYNSSTFENGGTRGYYWSSSSYSSIRAYAFSFGSSDVNSANSAHRYYGFPVRCVLK
ncbi:MAG: FISUMP domain-containing protein [Candidatus Saccharibacteria bacterium]|nr:FISUMP domain-containing protein [Candidatus Saccharibacteria bacterium]